MSFEELAIGYAIVDTVFTGGERFRTVYCWFEKQIKSECAAFDRDYILYLEAIKKITNGYFGQKSKECSVGFVFNF
ncbi:hypothetical protein MUK70_21375 [Dyadobacter chenwenxiniae]|uniref:Uncharacterized protein n=1 Tax=Dyadobacter chenwenxiniae TaxID=2906456 RepID=A0A9X1TEM6_9BACT|nr:hypothetical protein [Dyadobacter chenwenxiniae]MCF0061794.1 hypothetical protein [Dyadobacter chenwenxiniae]UON81610.1 hypothetical protein MUK70_21375 [Dyadobacter chenwenxiniae]